MLPRILQPPPSACAGRSIPEAEDRDRSAARRFARRTRILPDRLGPPKSFPPLRQHGQSLTVLPERFNRIV
jgi:hypothetical protein